MTKTADPRAQIREYFAALAPEARRRMQQMRAAIGAAAPRAEEGFSYRMPGFRVDGRPLVWYAAFTHHTSVFPITDDIKRAHLAELKTLKTSKGTVQFALDKPLPVTLLKRLVKARLAALKAGSR